MRRLVLVVLASVALAGCNDRTGNAAGNNAADAVADRNAATPVEMPFGEPPVAAAPAVDNEAAPASDQVEPDAAAAREVAVRYYDAIGRRDYGVAYALREPGEMSASAFAARFADYRSYRAEVGAPGRIDAGAGQRYIEVPVTVRAVTADGAERTLTGSVTLHHSAAIDGTTAEQRRWRIRADELK